MKDHAKALQRIQEVGRILARMGHWGVPLAVGIAVGYLMSDRSVSWVPTTLGVIIVVLIVSFALLPLGRFLQGAAFKDTPEKRGIRKRIVVLTALCVLAAAGRLVLYAVEQPAPLTELKPARYDSAFQIDLQKYRSLNETLKDVEQFFEQRQILLRKDAGVLSATEERAFLDAWKTLYDASFALDQIRVFHEDWYRFDPSRLQRDSHVRSFLLMYAAELSMYRTALHVTGMISTNKAVEAFLNSPHNSHGLPADSHSVFKQEVTGNSTLARIAAADGYLKLLQQGIDLGGLARSLGVDWVLGNIHADERHLAGDATFKKAIAGLRADVQPIKRTLRRNWLPTQKKVAMAMGDTKVRRIGEYLITPAQAAAAAKKLRPGDILLTRKNWYLSNVGLPGFWPHAILYLGTPDELEEYFDTPEVNALVQELSDGKARNLAKYLKASWPAKWRKYMRGEENHPYRLMEAVSEGVIFNTLEYAAGDYMAGLRPRLSKERQARAIIAAFGHQGKPYDFNFDFATDHAVVCTELVWRSYRKTNALPGLDIDLVTIMGRNTLPANEIAALYAKERGTPNRQLDFVTFLDAKESEDKAFLSDEPTFAKSHQRTKWDMQLP